jgi:hypothetical protein
MLYLTQYIQNVMISIYSQHKTKISINEIFHITFSDFEMGSVFDPSSTSLFGPAIF